MSSNLQEKEEQLLEAAATGDFKCTENLIKDGVNVNAQNKVNGWTALHWSSKRGYEKIVELLLNAGADQFIKNDHDQTAGQLSNNELVCAVLGEEYKGNGDDNNSLPITPNYIQHPVFPYVNRTYGSSVSEQGAENMCNYNSDVSTVCPTCRNNQIKMSPELVLKVRIAKCPDPDFIEIELNGNERTYSNLVETCRRELAIDKIDKIRKLPDTIVRNDKDIARLTNYQELEVIRAKETHLTSSMAPELTGSCISPFKEHVNLY